MATNLKDYLFNWEGVTTPLYPFKVWVAIAPTATWREDGTVINLLRNVGVGVLDKIFADKVYKEESLALMMPERWLNLQEQRELMSRVVKFCPNLKEFYLFTNSPVIVSDFTQDYLRVLSNV